MLILLGCIMVLNRVNMIKKIAPPDPNGMSWLGNNSTSTMNMSLSNKIFLEKLTELGSGDGGQDTSFSTGKTVKEIERTWLIPNKAAILGNAKLGFRINRFWLQDDGEKIVRIEGYPNLQKYQKITKTTNKNNPMDRTEVVEQLTKKEYQKLQRKAIYKDRIKHYDMPDGSSANIRTYPNGAEICMGEKEFPDINTAKQYVIPAYAKEVTNDPKYRGHILAKNNRK